MMHRDAGQAPPRGHISALEWAVAVLGLLVVLATLGVIVADALRRGNDAPDVTVRADSVRAAAGGWRVHFTAENRGRGTARALGIVGELPGADGPVTSSVTLDYLPGRSVRRGGLFFDRDPRGGGLRLRAEGYQVP